MKISEIGERELIERISRKSEKEGVEVGIGDDAAVINFNGRRLVLTVDALVEDDHFRKDWFLPKQVGMKAVEVNVSDIAAMNGEPLYALISLSLPKDLEIDFVDGFYEGVYSALDKYDIDLIGGNMTHEDKISVSVTLIGEVAGKIPLRKNAKLGDFIVVSGNLGDSHAGLNLFLEDKEEFPWVKKSYLEPKARLEKAHSLSDYCNAMEDCSDGLASEVKNICKASDVGAVVDWDKIPVSDEGKEAAKFIDKGVKNFALFGGEDFELVATVDEKYLEEIQGKVVGKIIEGENVFLKKDGEKREVNKSGYDHFSE